MATKNNIDDNELRKFSLLANDWWDKQASFKILHLINPIRLAYIKNFIDLNDKKVLDIGCGGGLLTEAMAKQGAIVTGIDASQKSINVAIKHAKEHSLSINYVVQTAETFSVHHIGEYDLITCLELLEHVPEPEAIINASAKMIKPGGHVIFSTINRHIKAYIQVVLAGEYLLGALPKGTHYYEKFIRPSKLVNWCRQYGLKTNDISGLSYNPLLKKCVITKKTDVNYLIDTIAINQP